MEAPKLSDPIDALAYHFRCFDDENIAKKTPLRIPSSLQLQLNERLGASGLDENSIAPYSSNTITNLVSSINEEEFERWCLLDATAFIFVTKILLKAEPCLAKDQGFFRLIEALETLRDRNSKLSMPERLLTVYKNTLGELLAAELLDTFVDCEESGFSRRWTGMLLVELLEESKANRDRVWKLPDKSFKDIGEVIVTGNDRMLKIVAGKIICQLMQALKDEEEIRQRLPVFFQPDQIGGFTNGFPLQQNSQWETGFACFVNDVELNRYGLNPRPPNGHTAVQVILGDNSLISTDIGVISINISEIFSIYIPPDEDRSPDWVDLKITNISKIEFTKQISTGDSMNDLVYVKLHLHDFEGEGYLYLLSMRPSSDSDTITILCYKNEAEDLAEDLDKFKQMVLRRKTKRQNSSAPLWDIQANHGYHQSQQEKIDELERHREDILKVLESPTAECNSDGYISSLTDPAEFEEGSDTSPPLHNPMETTEDKDNINKKGKEIHREDSIQEPILVSPAKKLATSEQTNQDRRTSATYPKNPSRTPDTVPELGFPASIVPNTNLKYTSEVTMGHSSLPLRSPTQARELQIATKPNPLPKTSSQPPIVAKSNYQRGLEEVWDILKGKPPSELWDNQRRYPAALRKEQVGAVNVLMKAPTSGKMPIPQKKQLHIHKPNHDNNVELPENSSGGLLVDRESAQLRIELHGSPVVEPLQKTPGDNLLLPIPEKSPPRTISSKENGVIHTPANNNKSTGIVRSADRSIPEVPKKHRAVLITYGTKNRAKGESKSKEKTLNKDNPSNQSKLQVIAAKSTKKNRASAVRSDKEKLPPPDDSIWDLPVSEESEKEARGSKKKGVARPKILSSKKPAPKPKQPAKPRPPPKRRVYGNKAISKTEAKSKEIISDSDKEIESLVLSPVRRQNQDPGPKEKSIPKAAPNNNNIFDQDSENEPGNKITYDSLRPNMKPKPKPKSGSAPASGLANSTLPKPNEDELMETSDEDPIRSSTPPTPTPRPRRKEIARLGQVKRTQFEDSDDEQTMPPSRKTGTKKPLESASTLGATKNNENGRKQKKSPTILAEEKKAAEVTPVSVLTKRAASSEINDDSDTDTGPQSKRKKTEQSKNAQTRKRVHQQPVSKKALENPKKRFKPDALLNTSEANDYSSWRPKTRLQAKLELAKKSSEAKKTLKNKPPVIEIGPGEEHSDETGHKDQRFKKRQRKSVRQRSILSSESSADEARAPPRRVSNTRRGEHPERALFSPEDDTNTSPIQSSSSESEPKEKISTDRVISDDVVHNQKASRLDRSGLVFKNSKTATINLAPIAVMSLPMLGPRYASGRSKNPPDNHFQDSALLQKQKQEMLLTLSTPRNMIRDPRTPQESHSELINEHLARKAQIISWGSNGPRNQGRTLIVEKTNAVSDIRKESLNNFEEAKDDISDSNGVSEEEDDDNIPGKGESNEEDTFSSATGRDLDMMIVASSDEDHIIVRRKPESNQPIRLRRKDTEIKVNLGQNPLPTVISRASEHITNIEASVNNMSNKKSRESSFIGLKEHDDAVSSPETESISDDDEQLPDIQNSDVFEKDESENGQLEDGGSENGSSSEKEKDHDPENDYDSEDDSKDEDPSGAIQDDKPTTSKLKGKDPTSQVQQLFKAMEFSSGPEDPEGGVRIKTSRDIAKYSPQKIQTNFEQRATPRSLGKPVNPILATRRNVLVANSYINEKPGNEWSIDSAGPTPRSFVARGLRFSREDSPDTTLNRRSYLPKEDPFSASKVTSTVTRGIAPEAIMAKDLSTLEMSMCGRNQKTKFSKWLQDSGLGKMANKRADNQRVHNGPNNDQQPRDPDKTLANRSGHDRPKQGQEHETKQGNNHGRIIESDDSNNDTSDTIDEDSDTGGEDEEDEDEEESTEDEELQWRQSVPDYHKESLSVLNKITRGLLRYLMSGEELAMQIVNDFEKQGKEIAGRLGASHKREYEEFLERVKFGKEKVQMEHARIMVAVEEDLVEVRKKSEALANMGNKLGEEYETLDSTIMGMIASLKEDLEESRL